MMFISIFTLMIFWYITQPLVVGIINACGNIASSFTGIDPASIGFVYPILRTLTNYWGPGLSVFLLILWTLMSTEPKETRGEYRAGL